jgi:clan AA aspartic protease (TIGR02281 family)
MPVAGAAVALAMSLQGTVWAQETPPPPPTLQGLTAEELIARAKSAANYEKRPEAERELWSIRVSGLTGTLQITHRGADTESDMTLGPFRTAHGESHGQRWHQNENGETILDRPEPSQVEKPLTQEVERVREPFDAWELETTFASGHETRLYYDPRTFYLLRQDRTVAGRTAHTIFDDFRTDARGRTRPWHYYGGDERPGNDYDYRLVRDDASPDLTDSDLTLPRDRRTLVEFPAGSDVVRLPARIDNGRIYVRLQIAGRGLDFLLDTGASMLTIDEDTAARLGLTLYGRATQTVAGSFATGRVVVPTISIGELTMHDVVMHTAPYASQEGHDTRVVGLLGFDFLDAACLKIDYASGIVEALRPGTLEAPAGATALDVRLNSGAPVTHAEIGEAPGDDFIIDTGAAFSFVIFQRFARNHPEVIRPEHEGRVQVANGIGGTMSYRDALAHKVELGTLTLPDVAGFEALSPNALGFDTEDGLIGADILKQFTVYLDYGASRVYLASPVRTQASRSRSPATHGKQGRDLELH